MRQLLVVLVFITSVFTAFSQRNPGRCEENPTIIDSVFLYLWNPSTLNWGISTIQIYSYQNTKVTEILTVDAQTRNPLNKSVSSYYPDGKLHTRINTTWANGLQVNVLKSDFSYVLDGNIEYQTETYYLWRNEDWVFWGKFLFEFVDGKRMRYLQQLINSNGELYDYAEYKLYYENNLLKYWDSKRLSDQVILFYREHFYDTKNRMTERIISRNFYNPSNKTNQLVFSEKTNYFYDQYSLNNEIINERWNGSGWENAEKLVYFRRIDNATRVRICFNGNSQCIPKAQVPKFLSKGATLGACPQTTLFTTRTQTTGELSSGLNVSETTKIYPNPASDFIQVTAGESFSRVDLLNKNGQTIRSFSLYNTDNAVIERNGLPSGVYFLRFVGQEQVKTEKVIFR